MSSSQDKTDAELSEARKALSLKLEDSLGKKGFRVITQYCWIGLDFLDLINSRGESVDSIIFKSDDERTDALAKWDKEF